MGERVAFICLWHHEEMFEPCSPCFIKKPKTQAVSLFYAKFATRERALALLFAEECFHDSD